MSYERVVTAALADTTSKKGLAEALARDIPAKRRGPTAEGERAVTSHLREAQEAIAQAGGEPRSVKTLADYRVTALWVATGNGSNFRWVDGTSFTAHNEARASGMTYRKFATLPPEGRTIESLRKAAAARTAPAVKPAPESIKVPADGEMANGQHRLDGITEPSPPAPAEAPARQRHVVREATSRPAAEVPAGAQTRAEVLHVLHALATVRASVSRLAALGQFQPAEVEMLADEGRQTLASVQFLADLNPAHADLTDEVSAFLRSQG